MKKNKPLNKKELTRHKRDMKIMIGLPIVVVLFFSLPMIISKILYGSFYLLAEDKETRNYIIESEKQMWENVSKSRKILEDCKNYCDFEYDVLGRIYKIAEKEYCECYVFNLLKGDRRIGKLTLIARTVNEIDLE